MSAASSNSTITVDGMALTATERFPWIVRLRGENFVISDDAPRLVAAEWKLEPPPDAGPQ